MEYLENFRNIFGNNNKLTNIDDKKILEFSKTLNLINKDKELVGKSDLNIPSIVVIGSQSSGKSSVLNGILAMDLLPTGKSMVTRTPLSMELIQTDKMYAEFGYYENLLWVTQKKINLTNPLPTQLEIEQIQKEIIIQTNKKAGQQMNISNDEINIKIFSPYVPNINLIDLPGLTMVACVDKGQPQDIKHKIRDLSKKYINKNNNIILCVMPAREDIEADNALELAKECDQDFSRTIGVLTKVDLMNKGNNVVNYLTNNISNSLKLNYGYFAIKNRSNEEMKSKNIIEGITSETNYFKNHQDYKGNYDNLNIGIIKLSNKLNEILLNNIRNHIPKIIKNINEIQVKNDKLLEDLGEAVPNDQNLKQSLMNRIINKIHNELTDNLEKKGSEINTGRNIKDSFIEFRKILEKQNPFLEKDCSDSLLSDIINNCEGNHMTFAMPSIELLENCLSDSKINPFDKLLPYAYACLDKVNHQLKELLEKILQKEFVKRFPKLVLFLSESINKEIFDRNRQITLSKINDIIDYEKNYIWTDDPNFLEIMNSSNLNNSNKINECLRTLSTKYFSCINFILQHSIPKSIMFFLVKKSQKELQSFLFDKTNNKIEYLSENSDVDKKRKKYNIYKEKLRQSLNTLQNL